MVPELGQEESVLLSNGGGGTEAQPLTSCWAELREDFLERPFDVGLRNDLELSCLWRRRSFQAEGTTWGKA